MKNLSIIWKVCSLLFIISINIYTQNIQDVNNFEIPDEQADSVHIISTTGNKVDYEMTAKYMYKYYDKKLTIADSVFVTFFYEDGSVKSTLYSDNAEMDELDNTITGIGNVVVKSENGTMKAPRVVMNRNTNQLFASEGVILIRSTNTLYGQQMRSDLNLDRAEIIKVSAEGKLQNEDIDF